MISYITQSALATQFVNRLFLKTNGLIKRQKKITETKPQKKTGCEDTNLTELMTMAEHFEITQIQIWQNIGFRVTKLQGQRPRITPGPPTWQPVKGSSSKVWPK